MQIKALRMIDFRRYDQASLEFGEGTNILHGRNGAGKTTILEAIHCLAYTRSFKTHLDANLLRHGRNRFQLKGSFTREAGVDLDVRLDVEPGKHKQMHVDGQVVGNRAEIIGRFPLVSLTPEDGELTFGSPEVRRQFLNKLLSQVDTDYLEALQEYQRLLKQRNAMLIGHAKHGNPVNEPLLETLDQQMADRAVTIQKLRRNYFQEFKTKLYGRYTELEQDRELRATWIYNVPGDEPNPETFREAFAGSHSEDRRRGITTRGPHRDILKLFLDQKDIRRYGSQGEHKLILVALKFAEGAFLENYLEEPPVFLLDDLFAELDVQHSLQIVKSLRNGHQIFITATDLADLRTHGLEIEDGSIRIIDALEGGGVE